MSVLTDYLNANFCRPWSETELAEHFSTKFGVDLRFDQDKVLFKYNMLEAKWDTPEDITKHCRGHIVRADMVWKTICNPFDKFHNLHEGRCPIFAPEVFEAEVDNLDAVIKADGSLIDVYWDDEVNDWKVSTSGSIVPGKVSDYPITFDELFWKIFGMEKKSIFTGIGKENTYIFELCSVMNRIVSRYKTDRVYLLAIRNNETDEYLDAKLYEKAIGVSMPERASLSSLGIKTQDELKRWVEDNTKDDDDVQYKEGYVIYRKGIPIAKVKASRYLALHHIGGGDVGCTRNNIIECFFTGTIDDVYGFLVDSMKEFADKLKEKTVVFSQKINDTIKEIGNKSFTNQKEYALYILGNVDKQFSSFFFANKEKLLAGKITNEDFTYWLSQNYKKFDEYWKS